MPIYQYECEICGQQFERRLPVSEAESQQTCPAGHHRVHRVFSAPAVMYKGNGFYVTDNPKTTRHKSE